MGGSAAGWSAGQDAKPHPNLPLISQERHAAGQLLPHPGAHHGHLQRAQLLLGLWLGFIPAGEASPGSLQAKSASQARELAPHLIFLLSSKV